MTQDEDYEIEPKDLIELPVSYLLKIREFLSTHTSKELDKMSLKGFIQESTGEEYSKIEKLITIAKKMKSLEQDFI